MSASSYVAQVNRWAVREGRKHGLTAQSVLVTLVSYVDLRSGRCWPKRTTLAADIYGTDEPTKSQLNMVSEAITVLFEAGLIADVAQRVNNGKRGNNEYVLNLPVNGLFADEGVADDAAGVGASVPG